MQGCGLYFHNVVKLKLSDAADDEHASRKWFDDRSKNEIRSSRLTWNLNDVREEANCSVDSE